MQSPHTTTCPYCGEVIELLVDPSLSHQDYIEDCSVCCRPMRVRVWLTDDHVELRAEREDD